MLEMFESQILNSVNQFVMARMNMQLLQHFNQHQTEDELNSKISAFCQTSPAVVHSLKYFHGIFFIFSFIFISVIFVSLS